MGGIPVIIIVLGLVVIIGAYIVSTYNTLIRSRENIQNAMGQIATNIESRWDALTSLISATKEYSEREANVLLDITKARSHVGSNADTADIEEDDKLFGRAMANINAVAEAYPDLKASNLYQKAMDNINSYENNVRLSRQIYNDTVTKFNRQIKTFPTNIIAGMFGFVSEDYFQTTSGKEDMPSW